MDTGTRLWLDYFNNLKRYAHLRSRELRVVIISILVMAFVVSYNDWGAGSQVDVGYGLIQFVGALIIVGISVYGRLMFQKAAALGGEYQAEFKLWSLGLLIAVILAVLTRGKLWFLIPGGLVLHFMPGHRMGWVRYGINWFGIGVASLFGPIANIIFAMIFRTLFELTRIQLFETAFIFNLIMALWNIIPIPPSDGSRMFFGSRITYSFGLGVVVSSAILLYSNIPVFITIPLSLVLGFIWYIITYVVWERFNWKGPY